MIYVYGVAGALCGFGGTFTWLTNTATFKTSTMLLLIGIFLYVMAIGRKVILGHS